MYSPNKARNIVHEEIAKVLVKHNATDRGVKPCTDFQVLNGTNTPALLLECLVLDSEAEEEKLEVVDILNDFCQAIADGIARILGVTSPKPA